MSDLKITNVQVFLIQPADQRLIVVKVLTNQPGLHGLGCATFTQRFRAVAAALEHHVGPFVIGKDPRDIEDLWQTGTVAGYWRQGPVLNNAISGVDMALWDILGKEASLPCHRLWGGPVRPAAAVYGHASGDTVDEVIRAARAALAKGHRYVRCQLAGYPGPPVEPWPKHAPAGVYYDPRAKLHEIPALFERLRAELGDGVELLHDVHERLAPIDAVGLAKSLEPYRLFYLEDLLAPEDADWFPQVRRVCATPLAMGELFSNPREYMPLIADRLIDFIRVHVSTIGGVTPALKLARVCEAFGVRTAWHGPRDVSPVGMMANVHMDVTCPNFGVQEWATRPEVEYEIFPGLARPEDGLVYPSDQPGWGIDLNEPLAAQYPCGDHAPDWTLPRAPDGSPRRP